MSQTVGGTVRLYMHRAWRHRLALALALNARLGAPSPAALLLADVMQAVMSKAVPPARKSRRYLVDLTLTLQSSTTPIPLQHKKRFKLG